MLIFTKIISWITNPKNRTIILFVIIALLTTLFFYQRSRTQTFKFKFDEQVKETNRVSNNFKASKDSIQTLIDKNGVLIAKTSGYQLTIDEMKNDYDSLFTLFNIEKNKPPKTIIEYKYKLTENISEIPTIASDSLISYSDSTYYGDGNWRIIKTVIPYDIIYRIKLDSVNSYEFSKVLKYAYELRENGIEDAFVVIYRNNKRISYHESLKLDSLIYRVQIYASNIDENESDILKKYNIREEIYKTYENGMYKYMIGNFVPKVNIEPIISLDELYTYAQLNTQLANTDIIIGMKLGTALYKDPKTGKISIQVKTKYPGIVFENITGVEIMNTLKENKKITRQFRQEWGIGFNIGYGGMLVPNDDMWNIKFGPVISIGINYTPRFLQFGPKASGKNTLNKLF